MTIDPTHNDPVRKLPALRTRAETGPMKFGDDWAGVFIRGDNAAYYAMSLRTVLERVNLAGWGTDVAVVKGLLRTLTSSIEGPAMTFGPVERDEAMDRDYIPLPGGWEIQTKGKGSTFRIAQAHENGERWPVCETELHVPLTRLGLSVRAAHETRVSELLAANNAEVERRRAAEATLQRAMDVLEDLVDHQNGCPLPKYEQKWTAAMNAAVEMLWRARR